MTRTAKILDDIRDAHEELPAVHEQWTPVHNLVEAAKRQANARNHERDGFFSRPNLVKAAALLVQAIEVMDRPDEAQL